MDTQGIAPFELYAIRYARHGGRKAQDNYMGTVDFHDAESDLDYYVWVARRHSEIYVIDTGFEEQSARERGREILISVKDGLALLGVATETVEHVILTHLHYDHAGTLDQFPKAKFHIQDAESAYATGRCMCHPALRHPFNVEDTVSFVRKLYGGQVEFHRGDAELAPGLTLHLVGGHTMGLQVVRVWTQRGWVVIASDATHLYGNIDRQIPFPIVYNVGDMMEGHKLVRRLADSSQHIIPGHDPQVMRRYPALSPDTAGKVVRLDAAPNHSTE
ncbi:N-acyl homoserine lactonase family protein [Paralcaligenes ureilyticus]|uniref:Glyoxylase-like metal-dependent hydrolase (Beta-lactamase superfamily II) n=1 Tax=Paralcaligenes ureilyticus TaxID=627131 RepID=A0A4V2UZE8_9BURK|nr:N-acyl homoserine lactonase family protein [Paralcaligenes ureilyticus]TCT11068.1 glyoxylase-like metal-dependent hydrolase (beta-lactamase superfamily II) [Paralcaligenes ureilyticus]